MVRALEHAFGYLELGGMGKAANAMGNSTTKGEGSEESSAALGLAPRFFAGSPRRVQILTVAIPVLALTAA